MASGRTAAVYLNVVDDVINKVRDDFVDAGAGAGEAVLLEIQAQWEAKLMQIGAISGQIDPLPANGSINEFHDLNLPYQGSADAYETPTAEMLVPTTPLKTPIETPLLGTVDQSTYNMSIPVNDIRNDFDLEAGWPRPYMEPFTPRMIQRLLGVEFNQAYVEGHEELDRGVPHQPITQDFLTMSSQTSTGYIPQQDGSDDEPPLNEEDDIHEDDFNNLGQGQEESDENHLVLALYERVTRSKTSRNRWRCTLKSGIMCLNNRDILFNKADGDFVF